MAKQSYSEKLKDPRWQKKRLEVMKANDFCCEICGDGESTLHVHHKEYFKNREPWDYDNKQLSVICEECHDNLHSQPDLLRMVCSFAPLDGPCNREELAFVIAGHLGIEYEKLLLWADAVSEPSPSMACNYEVGGKISDLQSRWLDEFWASYRADKIV